MELTKGNYRRGTRTHLKSSETGQLCKSGLKRHRNKSREESVFKSHFRLQSLFVFRELRTLPYRGSDRGIETQKRRLKENVMKENSGSNFKSVEPADMRQCWTWWARDIFLQLTLYCNGSNYVHAMAFIKLLVGTWTILSMFLLPFCALIVVGPFLSMEGQKALGFHQKYLNLWSGDEQRSTGFGTTWE